MEGLHANSRWHEFVNKNLYEFGEVKPDDFKAFEFEWKKEKGDIEYVESSCPVCTKVWYEDGKIKGTVDFSKVGTFQKGTESAIGKQVTVYINDGLPRFIPNEKMQKTVNPLKQFITLTITGLVIA